MIKCALYYDSNLFTNDEKCQVGITKIQDFIIILFKPLYKPLERLLN
jgi:hypothetical protein